jgi:ribose 5-phosphate isomerase B
MKISIGSDHAGFALKQQIAESLRASGHDVDDEGTASTDSTDYPDYAGKVGHKVASGEAEKGILVCSSGIGMSIAANKVHGVRAALAINADSVQFSRQHNDANVLALGAKYLDLSTATQFVDIFLKTPFEGGRHERRVNKIADLEKS